MTIATLNGHANGRAPIPLDGDEPDPYEAARRAVLADPESPAARKALGRFPRLYDLIRCPVCCTPIPCHTDICARHAYLPETPPMKHDALTKLLGREPAASLLPLLRPSVELARQLPALETLCDRWAELTTDQRNAVTMAEPGIAGKLAESGPVRVGGIEYASKGSRVVRSL